MAVELHEGGYALQQENSGKIVIQMKLTDSALRAVETYEDNMQMRKKEKPRIRFDGNQGASVISKNLLIQVLMCYIKLGTLPESELNQRRYLNKADIAFQNRLFLSRLENDVLKMPLVLLPTGAVRTRKIERSGEYCHGEAPANPYLSTAVKRMLYFCQDKQNATTGMFSVLGEIQRKITVNATDDSYNATKKRIEIVKELEKNISTKVIKQPGSKLGKKQHLRRKILDPKSAGSSFTHGRTSTPPPGRPTHSFSSVRSASPLNTASRSISPAPSGDVAGVRNKTKPILSSISSSSKPPPAAGRPLQERVLHYLALRPIKIQDLISKLKRGTPLVEQAKVQGILQQIATSRAARPGATEYSLHKNLYNDVQPDWCGYTEDEKAFVKRKLAEHNSRLASDGRKRAAQSADVTPKTSPSHQNTLGKDEETYSNPLKKKARVSLYNKTSPNPPRPRSVSPRENAAPMGLDTAFSSQLLNSSTVVDLKDSDMDRFGLSPTRNTSRKRSPKRPLSANSKTSKFVTKNDHERISPLTTSLLPPSDSFSTPSPYNTVSSEDGLSESKNSPSMTSQSTSTDKAVKPERKKVSSRAQRKGVETDSRNIASFPSSGLKKDSKKIPDGFIEKYKPIAYAEQREQYKSDFSAEYKEYLALHQKVVSQLERFARWQNELSQQEQNTEAYKRIARKVYDEYTRLQEDEKFHEKRERRDYLHRKLQHIKKLVLDYDSKQFARHDRRRRDGHERDRDPHRRSNDVAQKRAVLTA